MLVSHLEPILDKTGEGMANWSEQTGESGHHKVKIELSRFLMAEENPILDFVLIPIDQLNLIGRRVLLVKH